MKPSENKIGHNNLINGCLLVFQNTLRRSFESAIDNTLKDLFNQAENASSNQHETKLFEQYNALKKKSPKLLDSLASITQSMPDKITEQISVGEDNISLTIVEDEDLEISLALTQLESVLDIKFTKYLFALEKRLKILFASRNISKENMPFGTASICWIYSQTLDLSELDISTKSNIVDHLKKNLVEHLFNAYKIIDQKFVDAGILPNIKIESKPTAKAKQPPTNNKSTPQEQQNDVHSGLSSAEEQFGFSGGQPQSAGYGQSSPQQSIPNNNVLNPSDQGKIIDKINQKTTELVNSIFSLMNQSRSSTLQSNSTPATHIDNSMMDQTLDSLSKVTSVAAGSTEIDKLKEMILDNVRNETGIYYPSLSMEQQNSLDVMGMFYDQVKSDVSIDSNVLSSLNAINIPLIRTAINDNDFFDKNNHPAREYIEKIIYAAQKWHGTSVVKDLHKYSTSIASEYDGSNNSFENANENLDSFLRLTERRAAKAEEKWVNAAKGKEKLEISRHKVEQVVENISATAVPEFVKNVIKYVIQDSMTLSLLRHGENSDEWHQNIKTSETIAKMANPETIKDLTPKQKIESLHHLDQTMDELGFSENDRNKTLNNIKECAEAASNNTLDEEIPLSEVATINKNKKNVKKAGSAKIEELRSLTQEEKTELTKIKLMPYGTLFDFITNQQRDKIRRKLSWFSPVSNKALFVSLLGKKPYEKSLNAIAIDIVRNNILIVKLDEKKYFDKVLGTIFSKLKGLVN